MSNLVQSDILERQCKCTVSAFSAHMSTSGSSFLTPCLIKSNGPNSCCCNIHQILDLHRRAKPESFSCSLRHELCFWPHIPVCFRAGTLCVPCSTKQAYSGVCGFGPKKFHPPSLGIEPEQSRSCVRPEDPLTSQNPLSQIAVPKPMRQHNFGTFVNLLPRLQRRPYTSLWVRICYRGDAMLAVVDIQHEAT